MPNGNLILGRKKGQQINIYGPLADGERIVVTVIDRVGLGNVRIGVQAPTDVKVVRAEIDRHPEPKEQS